jgi:hypothetical protein
MKRLSLILTLSLLVFASLSFAQDSTTGIVRGQVLDTTSQRNPVAGVAVVIVGTSGEQVEASTDEAGSYRMENVQPGRYLFTISKSTYGARQGFKAVTVIAGGDHFQDLKITKKEPVPLLYRKHLRTRILELQAINRGEWLGFNIVVLAGFRRTTIMWTPDDPVAKDGYFDSDNEATSVKSRSNTTFVRAMMGF